MQWFGILQNLINESIPNAVLLLFVEHPQMLNDRVQHSQHVLRLNHLQLCDQLERLAQRYNNVFVFQKLDLLVKQRYYLSAKQQCIFIDQPEQILRREDSHLLLLPCLL